MVGDCWDAAAAAGTGRQHDGGTDRGAGVGVGGGDAGVG